MNKFTLHHGDCLESMRGMADNSVDSVVCDPPYGLSDHTEKDIRACMAAWLAGDEYLHGKKGFMNKTWDSFVPGPEVWREVFRVLKPGGYVLAFASTRTDDLMSMAMRLAGFRKHPFVGWIFGSGFPKAASLSKAFDREAGVVREVIGSSAFAARRVENKDRPNTANNAGYANPETSSDITAPATEAAKQWDGWAYGLQSLKPAIEPCLMFQKPHEGRMTDNVLQWGTGAVNIDACRVESGGEHMVKGVVTKQTTVTGDTREGAALGMYAAGASFTPTNHEGGRWPANLILSDDDCVVAGFPVAKGQQGAVTGAEPSSKTSNAFGEFAGRAPTAPRGDTGSAARFFYSAKVSKSERNAGLPEGMVNTHPTLKPLSLMGYLARLVTPPGGVVLDPFMGSGSTGVACLREGFNFIGCELDPEYIAIARARIQHEVDKIEVARVLADAAAAPAPQFDLFAS